MRIVLGLFHAEMDGETIVPETKRVYFHSV
jgi:hypothetical protein